MKSAIDDFVESLEKERQSNKLIEDNSSKKSYKKSGGFYEIASKLKKIMEMTCIGQEIKIEIDESNYLISIHGKDLSVLIGKDGKVIDAIEKIINLIGKRKKLIKKRVFIDIENYRKDNLKKIEKVAIKMAKKAVNERKKITLRPMPSYERKIVHNMLAKIKEVKTQSRFNEPNRRVVIYPVKQNNN